MMSELRQLKIANGLMYYLGQSVFDRDGKFVGKIIEILPECDSGAMVVHLLRPHYTGSDERDDAGIVAGTRCDDMIISRVQIADDPLCQVDTYHVQSRSGDEAINECDVD